MKRRTMMFRVDSKWDEIHVSTMWWRTRGHKALDEPLHEYVEFSMSKLEWVSQGGGTRDDVNAVDNALSCCTAVYPVGQL